jgi:lysophospholipase L1-like esterase
MDLLARFPASRLLACGWLFLGLVMPVMAGETWVGTWATSAFPEAALPANLPLKDATIRQVVRGSIGGRRVRLRFTNAFGASPLVLAGAHIALAGGSGAIEPQTDRALTFNGRLAAEIPPGAVLLSDPLDFDLPPLTEVAVSIQCQEVPAMLTTHPGSRTTSYVQRGNLLSATALPAATAVVHWYFLDGLEVSAPAPAGSIVALGDSITDGHGTTTDRNNRWTDGLAGRLKAQAGTLHVGVLNEGIGGNRLLRDGLGPNMLARFERDVLAQPGVRWVIVQAGINDIGTRIEARKHGGNYASADDIIGAYKQLITRARTHGLKIYGATISPYAGADFYWSDDGEADRRKVNAWIRTGGGFDAVIDFDAALRDPNDPTRLAPAFDSGDHLHPSLAGYAEMARVVDLNLFVLPPATRSPANP